MERGWRRLIVLVGGVGLVALLLTASGFFAPRPRTAVGQELPAAQAHAGAGVATSDGLRQAQATSEQQAAKSPEARSNELAKTLQENPKDLAAWEEFAGLQVQLRRFPAAADAYAALLELDPGNVENRTSYASSLLYIGMTRSAQAEYRRALKQEPDNPGVHMNLAIALSHSVPQDIDAAVAEWNEVLRLAPGQPIAAKAQEYLSAYKKP